MSSTGVSIAITCVNDIPTVTSGSTSINEDNSYTGTLTGSDIENGTGVIYSTGTNPQNGLLTAWNPSTGAFTYLPTLNWFGMDWFDYFVTDGSGATS